MNWEDLRLFVVVARAGGLGEAARESGTSRPTLGRRMRRLEEALGAELFRRHARGYDLTERGRALLEEAGELAERLERIGSTPTETLPVAVSAGTWTMVALAPHLAAPLDEGVRLRLVRSEDRLDIARRETLIGVRNARPTDPGTAARRIGTVRFAIYGADERTERWIDVLRDTPSARWVRERADPASRVEVSDPRVGLDMARAGLARIVLPTFIGDAEVALRRHGAPIDALAHEQWLAVHGTDRHAPPVRRTIDHVAVTLRKVHGSKASSR